MSNNLKTELDFNRERDNLEFAAFFWPNLFLAIGIGFSCTIGIIAIVVNADRIDQWATEVIKSIFI